MPPIPRPNDDDEEDDYEDEFEDDDDDDEGDFIPGQDDDDEDDEEPTELLQVQGTLRLDQDRRLVYSDNESDNNDTASNQGLVHLVSSEPLALNLSEYAEDAEAAPIIIDMVGTLSLESPSDPTIPAPRRKLQMTIVVDPDAEAAGGASLKSTGDDDDATPHEDGGDSKKPAAVATPKAISRLFHYKLFGREILETESEQQATGASSLSRIELKGALTVSPAWDTEREPIALVCDARLVAATAARSTAAPAAAAAAARAVQPNEDEDDDLEADADDAVDYDELIALHEEAGLPVEQLRKRLAEQQQEQDYGNAVANGSQKRAKRGALKDDEEEDYDGF